MHDVLESQSQNQLFLNIDNPRDKALVKLVLDTGLYVNELVSLHVQSIDWAHYTLSIEGKRKREEPLHKDTILVLKNWLDQRPKTTKPYLFLTLKGELDQLSSRGVDRILRKWGAKSNLAPLNFRTLRNTYKCQTDPLQQKDIPPNPSSSEQFDRVSEEKKSCSKSSTLSSRLEKKISKPHAIILVILVFGFVFSRRVYV